MGNWAFCLFERTMYVVRTWMFDTLLRSGRRDANRMTSFCMSWGLLTQRFTLAFFYSQQGNLRCLI